MAHDLNMPNPAKVQSELENGVESLKRIAGTIETTAQIGSMDLKIGGLNKTFEHLNELVPPVQDALKAVQQIQAEIDHHVAVFRAQNEDITF